MIWDYGIISLSKANFHYISEFSIDTSFYSGKIAKGAVVRRYAATAPAIYFFFAPAQTMNAPRTSFSSRSRVLSSRSIRS